MKRFFLLNCLLSLLIVSACKKQTEEVTSAPIEDYSPLVAGKYITYQLDSFKYLPFSLKDTTITYQVKYEVNALTSDNLGRPSFRIIRYIRKSSLATWVPDNTFIALNTGGALEFVENNQRFLKLKLPIKEGYTWKGNSYIDTYSLNSPVRYLDGWDYIYEGVNASLTVGTFHLDSTLTVNQRDEIIGSPGFYNEKNFSKEIYAKGIGLVYRKFLHTEYQPATPGSAAAYSDQSYGITLTMTGHN
ncbi:MAG: hypothetical protein JWP81_1513 [Ferruginibacter sp.]|nr:hypothetical protein [Ferruginibacter sp.]